MKSTDLNALHELTLLRLKQVLEIVPISRSAWYLGVASGKYPTPTKMGARTAVYKLADIKKLISDLNI